MSSLETWIRIYRATLDTNIFLRALIRRGNLCHRILQQSRFDAEYPIGIPQIVPTNAGFFCIDLRVQPC